MMIVVDQITTTLSPEFKKLEWEYIIYLYLVAETSSDLIFQGPI